MSEYRLTHKVSKEQIDMWARKQTRECIYAVQTPWWSLYEDKWMPYTIPDSRLPCDPRGSVLMQGNLAKFWKQAQDKPEHYGKHGIDALVAAFHSNVEVMTSDRGWHPTSLDSWDRYNDLLDKENNNETS